MKPVPDLTCWLQSFGVLALQVALVVALATGLQVLLRTAAARRATWLGAMLGLVVVVANGLIGADRLLARWSRPQAPPAWTVEARGNLPPTLVPAAPAGQESAPLLVSREEAAPAPSAAHWWPVWLWLAGGLVVGGRALAARLALMRWAWRGATISMDEPAGRITALAARMGLRYPVRLMESAALAGPIAFGWWRPTIGLPREFFTRNSPTQQDAILAHELAHLTARDPLWLALADALCAVLWWHPAAWWVRRRFRAASETAADDASLLVKDGPVILAECLVALAAQMRTRRASGWLGMAEFRSGLGRRVERLLSLRPEATDVGIGRGGWIAPVLAVAVLLGLAGAAWAFPGGSGNVPTLLGLVQAATGSMSAPTGLTGPGPNSAGSPTIPASLAILDAPAMPAAQPGTNAAPESHLFSLALNVDLSAIAIALGVPLDTNSPAGFDALASALRGRLAAAGWSPDASAGEGMYLNYRQGRLLARATLPNLDLVRETIEQLNALARGRGLEIPAAPAAATPSTEDGFLTRHFKVSLYRIDGAMPFPTNTVQTTSEGVLNEGLGRLFAQNGWAPGPGESFHVSERQETLVVRAAQTNFLTIEAVLGAIHQPLPQVCVTAEFVELTEGVAEAVGLEKRLSDLGGAVTSQTVLPGETNELERAQGLALPGAELMRTTVWQGAQHAAVLTKQQASDLLGALRQRRGVEVMATPSVTTISARQAQVRVGDLMQVVVGVDTSGGTPKANTLPMDCGLTLDLLPTVLDDLVTIDLNVEASLMEFRGYEPPTGQGAQSSRFRLRQMRKRAFVWHGQTLLLVGPLIEASNSDTDPATPGPRSRLLVFITPTVLGDAGKPLHTDEEMPFATDAVPPQPRPAK